VLAKTRAVPGELVRGGRQLRAQRPPFRYWPPPVRQPGSGMTLWVLWVLHRSATGRRRSANQGRV
jgi:hypothetical protein